MHNASASSMIIAAQAIQAAVFVEGGSRNSNESRLSDMATHNLKQNLLYILSIYIYTIVIIIH